MSINPFKINSNPFQTTLNSFLVKDNKNQQTNPIGNNSSINLNIASNQSQTNQINQFSTGTNPFNINSGTFNFLNNSNNTNNNNNIKKEENNQISTFSFLNKNNSTISNQTNINSNIFNNNIEKNKNNSILNSNINNNLNNNTINFNNNSTITNNINNNLNNKISNNSNNDTFNFFNLNNNKNQNGNNNSINTNSNILNKINNKKEDNSQSNNIFMIQSNNILNKLKNDSNANKDNKDNENKTHLNLDINNNNKNKSNNLLEELSKNNNKKKEEKEKADEFINNLLVEHNLVLPEKEMIEYEKSQLSYKLNDEIINEFKTILFSQKEKFKNCIKNVRLFEEKIIHFVKLSKNNAKKVLENQKKYEHILQKLDSICIDSNILKENLIMRDKTMSDALNYIKNNRNKNNINNNFNSLKKIELDDNEFFYKDIKDTSEKIKKIDKDIMIISNFMEQNEKNIYNNNNRIKYEKNNNGYLGINNELDGIILERKNFDKKIYIEQNDMNEILTDCYNGLSNLKYVQDEFEIKYNNLRNKLINKINQNNNKDKNIDKFQIINNVNSINNDSKNNIMNYNNNFI